MRSRDELFYYGIISLWENWAFHERKVIKEISDDLMHILAVFRLWRAPRGPLRVPNGQPSVPWEVEMNHSTMGLQSPLTPRHPRLRHPRLYGIVLESPNFNPFISLLKFPTTTVRVKKMFPLCWREYLRNSLNKFKKTYEVFEALEKRSKLSAKTKKSVQ